MHFDKISTTKNLKIFPKIFWKWSSRTTLSFARFYIFYDYLVSFYNLMKVFISIFVHSINKEVDKFIRN